MGRYRGRRKLREKEEWGGGGKFVMTFKYNIIPSVTHSHTLAHTHTHSYTHPHTINQMYYNISGFCY